MLLLSFVILILIHTVSYRSTRKYASGQTDTIIPVRPAKPARPADYLLICTAGLYAFVMLVLPVFTVLSEAFSRGVGFYLKALTTGYALSSYAVSLLAVVIAVPAVTCFGIAASMLLSRFDFKGKRILSTLIDIPFSVSPVIAGLSFIMMFGRLGWAYPLTEALGIKIAFALPGVVLATIFVIFPYVSRELVPTLSASGRTEEEAAAILGAGGLRILRSISIPKMKWALGYGIVLATARAFGEFGAVSALSKTRGKTFTLPLEIDALYYAGSADSITEAFALSSVMLLLAAAFLILKTILGEKKK
ncbi:MAG: ABC transporter permease subunit [Lachnospiraceae bacterium]|nr:ABC transporter permease subunit [Lachnospiraceae bacterium]